LYCFLKFIRFGLQSHSRSLDESCNNAH